MGKTLLYDMIAEFHQKFDLPIEEIVTTRELDYRKKLIDEEHKELGEAIDSEPCENILKELVDTIYVLIGTAVEFGWDIDEALRRVHKSNLSKLGEDGKPIFREDGKVLKGPNYREPNLEDLV